MLPRTAPSALGVDAEGIAAFVRAAIAGGVELHSLIVVRRGCVVAEGYWEPYTARTSALLYSLSKTFTSVGVGIAIDEGLVDLDERVADALGHVPPRAAPWVRQARVRDLLSMSTGHEDDPIEAMREVYRRGGDPLAHFLTMEAPHAPGAVFTYNQGATLTLSAILARVTGEPLLRWLGPRLLAPMGLEGVWSQPMPGVVTDTGEALAQGYSGIHAPTEAVACLGELLRCEGRWGDRQLVSADYVRAARTPVSDTAMRALHPDWRLGYGFQLWPSRHGYRGDGAFGQLCLVLPEQEAVVAVTAQAEAMQRELDLVWAHLLPALGGPRATPVAARTPSVGVPSPAAIGPEPTPEPTPDPTPDPAPGTDADEALAALLAGLALPMPQGGFAPGAELLDRDLPVLGAPALLGRVSSVRFESGAAAHTEAPPDDVRESSPDDSPQGSPGASAEKSEQPELSEDPAHRRGDARPVVVWRADGCDHPAPIGVGRWARGRLPSPWTLQPAVAVAGEADARAIRLRIVYLQSPHSLTLLADADGARLTWDTTPLGSARP